MSEEFQSTESGEVMQAEAAVQQVETTQPNQEPSQTGEQTSAADSQRVEQAFAKRLASERQKIEQEYTPYRGFVEAESKRHNMTPQQYLQAVEQQRQAEERQSYVDQGINPDLVNQLLEKHPDVQYARQMRSQQEEQNKFNAEASEFLDMFPDIDVATIPNEVYNLKRERGLSLADSYLRTMYPKIRTQTEQDVIKKLQGNAQSSPGSLGQGGGTPPSSISSMSKSDFAKMQEEVLRGERKQI